MQSISIGLLLLGLLGPKVTPPRTWRSLAPGMDLAYVGPGMTNSPGIAVLRIDLKHWELEVMGSSQTGESGGHTAREWCETRRYTAAINAGMFATDARTHLGYLRFQGHVNNGQGNAYQSVAAFDPREPGSAVFRIFDLDAPGISLLTILKNYAGVVQNLRLIKRPGLNQWGQQTRQWSEAALGEDDAGRALFIFARTPYSMHDLNRELMAAGIGLVAAQHLEGGPEAQLYLHVGEMELEMFGSFETGFMDNSNAKPWPVPNVLAVRPRATTGH
jgi:hypothetical protein